MLCRPSQHSPWFQSSDSASPTVRLRSSLARKAKSVIGQNIGASLVLAVVGLALAATGNINIWFTPFYYALGYIIVIANSLRLIRFGEDFTAHVDSQRQIEASRVAKPVRHLAAS